jgi:DNA replication protein DnaC
MINYIPCNKNGCVNGWVINDTNGTSVRCKCRKEYDAMKLLSNTGIPDDYLDKSFENFNPKNETEKNHIVEFRKYVEEFKDKRLADGRGLYIFGKTKRIGKTHCAVAIAREVLAQNYDESLPTTWVYYINVSELFDMLWSKISIEKGENPNGNPELRRILGVLEKIKECKLLILDDLGVTRRTDFVTNTLYTIIEYRTTNNRPIIATSNCELPEIILAYGEDGDRIAKRLKEKVRAKQFYGVEKDSIGGKQ